MSYRMMFVINAFVAFLFGVALLILPTMAINRFGVDEYASTKMVAQFFGTALVTLGLFLWFAKDINEPGVTKGIVIALLVGTVVGLVVTVIGTVSGTMRTNGWIAIIVYVLFGLAYGYLVFLKPQPEV